MKRLLAFLVLLSTFALCQTVGSGGVMLSGAVVTGTNGGHNVALSWAQSTSPNIASNRVYRSTTKGAETPYYTCPAPCTTYTDSLVSASGTYYYTVTATNTSGQESVQSNEFTAVIP